VVTARDRFAVRRRPHHSGADAGRLVGLIAAASGCRCSFKPTPKPLQERRAGEPSLVLESWRTWVTCCSGLWPPTRNSPSRAFSVLHWPWRGQWVFPPELYGRWTVARREADPHGVCRILGSCDLSRLCGTWGSSRARPRSIVIVSYALSGFSNFASIAIQIGGIAPLAPSRRGDIARLGLKAMIGGALASYMLAPLPAPSTPAVRCWVSSSRDRPASLFCWRDRVNAVLHSRNEGACTDIS